MTEFAFMHDFILMGVSPVVTSILLRFTVRSKFLVDSVNYTSQLGINYVNVLHSLCFCKKEPEN